MGRIWVWRGWWECVMVLAEAWAMARYGGTRDGAGVRGVEEAEEGRAAEDFGG
ncbi:hypothetical protein E1A91_A04G165900v1 [Gossypium mustelinum]|uniref:Uncharacterized protein n=1 Tax=Gossypium mustelinum TaxID=34275 RepID=A0A5D2ZQ96_GOSMU|nr:hypothetical protein E1A91_D05G153100v1 [Gossypium mustelinum]TYJ40801.1 hypothetical protein E1A91_A04G165800v1 [Gossypium mustelinum]TYJ40802.1 hypothetical protein E1A91_A04G165900v1 [Gossypium mustelinum]